MGKTLIGLSSKKLEGKPVFDRRMVVEVAETFHFHYRNLRIVLSQKDWEEFGKGLSDAWTRWVQRGKPLCSSKHIELCRKEVASKPIDNDFCKVNLNKNLYAEHEGQIFADGAELEDDTYIHLKIRDLRIELTKAEFKILAEAVKEANDAI